MKPKPIYCPRRHGIECDTPNACAGGADCRFGPDLNTRMNDRTSVSKTTDLVTRLRECVVGHPALMDAAADEIERLRKLLWMIQDQGYHPSGYLKDQIEAAVKYD